MVQSIIWTLSGEPSASFRASRIRSQTPASVHRGNWRRPRTTARSFPAGRARASRCARSRIRRPEPPVILRRAPTLRAGLDHEGREKRPFLVAHQSRANGPSFPRRDSESRLSRFGNPLRQQGLATTSLARIAVAFPFRSIAALANRLMARRGVSRAEPAPVGWVALPWLPSQKTGIRWRAHGGWRLPP